MLGEAVVNGCGVGALSSQLLYVGSGGASSSWARGVFFLPLLSGRITFVVFSFAVFLAELSDLSVGRCSPGTWTGAAVEDLLRLGGMAARLVADDVLWQEEYKFKRW